MQGRYDANWYGYLAKQRLDAMLRSGVGTIPPRTFPPDSVVARAIANLQTVTVAEETAGAIEDKLMAKADELNNVGLNDWALEELAVASSAAGNSPKVNLAIARVYRSEEDNVRALNVLKKSFPDYSQMKPAEMTREEWDVFYPLAYWDIIVQESRAKSLDPYQVAGLIRQETVFMSRARSSARAYGLMQLLVPTGTLDREEVWSGTRRQRRVAIRTTPEYSTRHCLPARPDGQVWPHRICCCGLQRWSTAGGAMAFDIACGYG